ncbi:MAG: tRNA (adenosine(37)-N6)-dimethylallyltransferase MiaA [Deltaproteobacteria bacterium]|nr:tRNA (adenosine(37)-N6)-dimethylallyltransferase MiaA [Deltaproteobacteria bacterium]
MKKIIVIVGPTGIGKTSFAIKAATHFNGEIVGADSMQIYKHMDIGTAKPDSEEMIQAPHHLVDFLDPKEEFDAGAFVRTADKIISDIISRGKIPIVVGGTGLYVRALINGLFRSTTINEQTLEQLTQDIEKNGNLHVYHRLQACDPIAAKKIHPNDTFRVIRALEVFLTTGKKISDRHKSHNFKEKRYDTIKIGLFMDREKLYQRINMRVDIMLDQGLLNEVRSLVEKGYSLDLKTMQSIGYKQMGLFIKGEVDWDEAIRLLKRDTRRYAKRQMTWFKKESNIRWYKPDEFETAIPVLKDFLT